MVKNNQAKGFTLIEVLLVIAIITVLSGVTILVINPGKRLADARNAQRTADINIILNAVYQYSLDNNSMLPESITVVGGEICKEGLDSEINDCDVSLLVLLEDERYLVSLPQDPNNTIDSDGIGYNINKTVNGRITITAPNAEDSNISITR